MSTLKTSNIQHASAASAAITLDTNGQATLNGLAYPTSGSLSGRSRIINGSMMIDQRNAGASGTANAFTVDRFYYTGDQASKITWQQNAGSVTPPAGFTNYLGFTTTTAYSVGASESFRFEHSIEGFNVSDLAWGTANAQAVTISFWVRSSLTGTHGATLQNSARSRSYPFTWSISSANTWEYKTITIAGDTSGTWLTNNGVGIRINFNLGAGATLSGAAGSWSGNNYVSPTGATSVVGTNGATFYITGVQLEAGSVATPFERRSYGQELLLAQRYYQKSYLLTTVPGTATFENCINTFGSAAASTAGTIGSQAFYRVEMRALATISIWDANGNSGKVTANPYGSPVVHNNNATVVNSGSNQIQVERSSGTACNSIIWHYVASAEL